jgi:hypothetical protein
MKPTELPDLPIERETEAKDLFVITQLEPRDIAARMGVNPGSVRKARTRGGWQVERIRYLSQQSVKDARAAHAAAMAEAQATVELGCAQLAVERIAAQLKVARELHRLASEKVPQVLTITGKEGQQGLASALGPASADITSGRLAVNLTTEKSSIESDMAAQVEALRRVLRGEDGTSGGDGPEDGLHPAQPASEDPSK